MTNNRVQQTASLCRSVRHKMMLHRTIKSTSCLGSSKLLLVFGCLLSSGLLAAEAIQTPTISTAAEPAYSDIHDVKQLRLFAFDALRESYPKFDLKLENNKLVFPDGTALIFDDGITRTSQGLLESPDIFDRFFYRYPSLGFRQAESSGENTAGLTLPTSIPYPEDPGRVRNDQFFMSMYGANAEAVKRKLAPVKWIPSGNGPALMITTVNGVNKAAQAVSDELDKRPELWPYLLQPGGSFMWRVIAGTNRLSVHSFGAAIDINVAKSDYWRYVVKKETDPVAYRNRIPVEIVEIFERHGFIWGGWWYHFDTMHFEYRPEILRYMKSIESPVIKSRAN
jgi:peptidoglycan L-alanyl-D-glutamate endopeptidase CwlK